MTDCTMCEGHTGSRASESVYYVLMPLTSRCFFRFSVICNTGSWLQSLLVNYLQGCLTVRIMSQEVLVKLVIQASNLQLVLNLMELAEKGHIATDAHDWLHPRKRL